MKFQNISQKLLFYVMTFLGIASSFQTRQNRGKIGKFLGIVMKLFSPRRQKIAMTNLNIAFPDKPMTELKQIMTKSFHNLGIVFLEVAALKYMNKKQVEESIVLKNHELINKVLEKGRGAILLSGHYGNWEYVAMAAGLYCGVPITIVVQHQKNKLLDEDLNKARTQFGNNVVSMTKAARSLISAIKSNEAIALLADQSAKLGKDSFVDFFGKPALTFDAPAELALKFRTPIVYAFPRRKEDYSYEAELKELDFSDLEYTKENVTLLTQRHVKILEDQIKAAPEFWAWQHRRWKHSQKY